MSFYWVVWKREIYSPLPRYSLYLINKSKLLTIGQVLLNTLHCIVSFTYHNYLWGGYCYYQPHFRKKKTRAREVEWPAQGHIAACALGLDPSPWLACIVTPTSCGAVFKITPPHSHVTDVCLDFFFLLSPFSRSTCSTWAPRLQTGLIWHVNLIGRTAWGPMLRWALRPCLGFWEDWCLPWEKDRGYTIHLLCICFSCSR